MGAVNGTRRDVLRGPLVAAVTAVLAPLVAASRPTRAEPSAARGPSDGPPGEPAGFGAEPEAGTEAGPSAGAPGPAARFEVGFDEMYRGRRIRGLVHGDDADDGEGTGDLVGGVRIAAGAAPAVGAGSWRITVDDRPLHLMRRADGGYLTMVDHYQSYPTPLAAARAAVDELGGTLRLRAADAAAERGEGHRHGVHA